MCLKTSESPLPLTPLSKILTWNMKVNNYINFVFIFACKFLVENGFVLLFHLGKNIVKGVTQVNGHFLKLHFCMFERSHVKHNSLDCHNVFKNIFR
jgi:hypothetical protein